jgi:polar amino acid transport system substrate-binding protein
MISVVSACGSEDESDDGKAEAMATKTLKVATSSDYPPFEYVDTAVSDEIIGFDIDLVNLLAEELGYKLEIENVDFNGFIPALQAKSGMM